MSLKNHRLLTSFVALMVCVPLLTGCKDDAAQSQDAGYSQQAAEVTVYAVQQQEVELTDVLPGRVAAFMTAEIRPQVSGIVQKRLFEQGTEVQAGQILYQIDPSPFEADRKTAEAAVKYAEATLSRAQAQAKRLKSLVDSDAISAQAYDDIVAERLQADANLTQARATLERRALDVKFAAITSPISGRIDQAVITEGALATAGETNPMATVQQIDQVFVDVRQPASRLEKIREAASLGQDNQGADVRILSGDGKPFNVQGKLLFSGVSVDPTTGEVLSRVLVPNKDRILLPGMYVQAELPLKKIADSFLVPQQSVKRSTDGKAQLYVVAADGKVAIIDVEVGQVKDGMYVVQSGLKGGENIIVEGHDKVMPEATVKTVPWGNKAQAEPAVSEPTEKVE